MAIRDSQTGRLWSARQTDGWARLFEAQMAARAADYREGGEMDETKTEFDTTDHDCPDGHGPMVLYPSAPDDDTDDIYECPTCGHRQEVAGQRSADPYDGD